MGPCVYTTQHGVWLREASVCEATKPVCFRSNKKWATASNLLEGHGTLPILIREQDRDTEVLECTYFGELIEAVFPRDVGDVSAQMTWLGERLWLQEEHIKRKPRTLAHPTWQSEFQVDEISPFLRAQTWYLLRNVREIEPLPISHIHKLNGDHPLAPNFIRGYALCRFPEASIRSRIAS